MGILNKKINEFIVKQLELYHVAQNIEKLFTSVLRLPNPTWILHLVTVFTINVLRQRVVTFPRSFSHYNSQIFQFETSWCVSDFAHHTSHFPFFSQHDCTQVPKRNLVRTHKTLHQLRRVGTKLFGTAGFSPLLHVIIHTASSVLCTFALLNAPV